MPALPDSHPQRPALADEVHARPPEPLSTPSRVAHLAVLIDPAEREAERQHLLGLCRTHGVEPPSAEAGHVTLPLGPLRLKWERHGEFSGWTFIVEGDGAAGAFSALPEGWLAGVPGRTIMAAEAQLLRGSGAPADAAQLAQWFGAGSVVIGSQVADGAGCAYTDFKLRDDGCLRFVVLDNGFTPRQAGRVMQRLFEIEVYRLLALLALPVAQALGPRTRAIETALGTLTADIGRDDGDAPGREEALLHELTRLAAEVEQGLLQGQYRFGACRAYSQLVATRVAELRESRLSGLQTIEEFMSRRFSPAVATCATVSQRLHELSERVAQASSLLATRVGIARERQNQALLASMDRRARLQLRLQQTVEGLSVAAITYYAAGLVGYLAKGAKAAGVRVDPDLVVGLSVPVLVLLIAWGLRRARRHLHAGGDGARH